VVSIQGPQAKVGTRLKKARFGAIEVFRSGLGRWMGRR